MTMICITLTACLALSPWTPNPQDSQSSVEVQRGLAVRAIEEGDIEKARHHLEEVFLLQPFDSAGWLAMKRIDLLTRKVDDVWLHHLRLASSLADKSGVISVERTLAKLLPGKGSDPFFYSVPKSHAQAIRKLASAAKALRSPKDAGLAWWLRDVAREVMMDFPALRKAYAPLFEQSFQKTAPPVERLIEDLHREMELALSEDRMEDALAGGRLLQGLISQSNFKHLQELAPDMSKPFYRAGQVIEIVRESSAGSWVERTREAMFLSSSPKQRARLSERYLAWNNPAVAYSPTRRYRIQTTCGLHTLQTAVRVAEKIHARTSNWMGADPFKGILGEIFLVPTFSELEREGLNRWWALGFPAGNRTAILVSCTTERGLERLLAHELTHRFDGALHPGLPEWALEGRADYAAGAYEFEDDIEIFQHWGAISSAKRTLNEGYDRPTRFRALLQSEIEDYRDNYFAGLTLWTFLNSWKPAKPLFRERIPLFIENGLSKDPVDWFEKCFADGLNGRPSGLNEFIILWQSYLVEVKGLPSWTLNPEDWPQWARTIFLGPRLQPVFLAPSTAQSIKRPPIFGQTIFDAPTWSNERVRYPPSFGEGHAASIARFFMKRGKLQNAAFAFEWSRRVEAADPTVLHDLAATYTALGDPSSAQSVLAYRARLLGILAPKSPEVGRKLAGFRRILDPLLGKLEKAKGHYFKRGGAAVSIALSDRIRRIRTVAGISLIPEADQNIDDKAKEAQVSLLEPCPPEQLIGWRGWAPDTLGEDKSNKAWLANGETLILGSKAKDQAVTGDLERGHGGFTFVRGREWKSGSYDVKVLVKPMTSHVQMSVIIGFSKGWRTFSFDLGVWSGTIRGSYGDHYRRTDGLHSGGSSYNRTVGSMKAGGTNVLLEFQIRGNKVAIFLNDDFVGIHHAGDSLPIEGYIGFAIGRGAVTLVAPSVRQHYWGTSDLSCRSASPIGAYDPKLQFDSPWNTVVGRDFPVGGVPADGLLAIVLDSIPKERAAGNEARIRLQRNVATAAVRPLKSHWTDDELERIVWIPEEDFPNIDWKGALETRLPVKSFLPGIGHSCLVNAQKENDGTEPDLFQNWGMRGYHFLFIDSNGVIRAADYEEQIARWYRVLRGY